MIIWIVDMQQDIIKCVIGISLLLFSFHGFALDAMDYQSLHALESVSFAEKFKPQTLKVEDNRAILGLAGHKNFAPRQFKFFIPAGTTNVAMSGFLAGPNSQFKMAYRLGDPPIATSITQDTRYNPDRNFIHLRDDVCVADEFEGFEACDIGEELWVDSKDSNIIAMTYGKEAGATTTGQWLYVHILNNNVPAISGTNPSDAGNLNSLSINMEVDFAAYSAWYNANVAGFVNQEPIDFAINPVVGSPPLNVSLSAEKLSATNILSWNWSSSDGQTTAGESSSLNFMQLGKYTITLTANANTGGITTLSHKLLVNISPLLPIANFTATPISGSAPLNVQLDASKSNDPDGSIVSYTWSASDGQIQQGSMVSMQFATNGVYTVTLTVTDDGGNTNSNIQTIYVGNSDIPPVAAFTMSPTSGSEPLTVSVNGATSSDTDGSVVAYNWTTSTGLTASGQQATLTFSTAGTHTIVLTVIDDGGNEGSTERVIIVNAGPQPPVAVLNAEPTSGLGPLTVTLDASESYDPDGGSIISYIWEASTGEKAFGKSVNMTFTEVGDYTVTLYVLDSSAAASTKVIQDIQVLSPEQFNQGKFSNVSTRSLVQLDDDVMIAGFIITGGQKQLLVTARGPSLTALGVNGALVDPTLDIYSGQTLLFSNNDWDAASFSTFSNPALLPTDPKESALLLTLPEGAYTAIVRGANRTTGVALVTVTDIESNDDKGEVLSLSTRSKVDLNDNVMIAGFIIEGAAKQVLIRVDGPLLATLNTPAVLADPLLELYSGSTLIGVNDNWQTDNEAAIAATNIAPSNPLESAILMTLQPGAYTAIVRGIAGLTGNALVSVTIID